MTKIAKQVTQRRRGITGRLRRKKKFFLPTLSSFLSPSLRRLDRDSTKKISGEPKNIFMSFSRFLATSRQATAVAKSLDVFFEIGDRKTAANGVRNATISPTSLEVRAPTEPSEVKIFEYYTTSCTHQS